MSAVPATSTRLHWFIDAILMEERKFRLWSHQLHLDFRDLEKLHAAGIGGANDCARHAEMRKDHEEVFERHRRIRGLHNDARDYCEALLQRLDSGHFLEGDFSRELEKLSSFYEAIRADHNLMVRERRRLVAEHRALEMSQPDRPSARKS